MDVFVRDLTPVLQTELRASVANCLIGGDSITQTGDSWIRDVVEFNCGGYRYRFRQRPEIIKNSFEPFIGSFFETTEVTVADVAEDRVQEVKTAIERICWLLSFVGSCRVIPFEYEYPNGSGLIHSWAVSGVAPYYRPVFEIFDGTQIKSFVEQTYKNYVLFEQSRKLNVVIDYLAQAEAPGQLVEVKLILIFVALENLKHTFAHSKDLRFIDGYFRKSTWKRSDKNRNTYSFKDLVKMMLDDVNTTYDLTSAIKLRNDLIHTGLSEQSYNFNRELYEDVHDLIREYLLRFLGYRGHYSPYAFERRGVSAVIE
ncbi:MAG: hypothetical protein ACXV8Q_10725 [Methylobacter sp.]